MARNADELIRTRATLLHRLKNWQDQTSWEQFFETYWKLIYGFARKAGLNEAEAQDVVQETMFAIVKHMPTFTYDPTRGSFKGWLLNMARWRIIDQIRKRRPLSDKHHLHHDFCSSTGTDTIGAIPDPAGPSLDQYWETEWQTNLLESAMNNVKRRLDPEKYQLFDCYVNKEWAPEKVAATFGVSVNQVYQAKHRITEMVKAEVARLEKEVT
ncbi:MAG TPA: sigma-70 family RNA polymerase sigma factor [Candidatus Limnocylindrales bacterium]|jgi:RNA polymerase sigma-70 factor (ECF subfamily)|nr:sigma-70 family RNA polymerase sigma factor [Candidatus Limnocylindrales bacterium]